MYIGVNKSEDCDDFEKNVYMCEWSEKWMLRFHAEKCKTIRMSLKQCSYKIYENGKVMEHSDSGNDIGVIIDNRHIAENIFVKRLRKLIQSWLL